MGERRPLCVLAGLASGLVLLAGAVQARAEAIWRLEQPDPPPGYEFKTPLGPPGDLQFYSRNRGLLGVEGNAAIPRGLYHYDGETWKQLATVCGGSSDTMRIAWAGPAEFWTVSEPSPPRRGAGITLCRFKDGQVAASYGTPDQSPDPYQRMNAATCRAPDDCWFGGIGTRDPAGTRRGAFHLHWNGSTLETVYNPQGRGVSDLEAHGGTIFETVHVGRRAEDPAPAELAQPESPKPRLLHRIAGGAFTNDPFVPRDYEGEPVAGDGTELLALDSSGDQLWATGGGTASGPSAPPGGVSPRQPLAARLVAGRMRELDLVTPPGTFTDTERFVDVAAVPGTDDAWVAVQPFADRRRTSADARAARIDGATGAVETFSLPASGAGRGSAARIAFTDPNDGWLVTYAGWLFHWTDGSRPPRDTDPAFANRIDFRPNENASQFVPDRPPVDDASTLAPPPLEVTAEPAPEQVPGQVRRLPALLSRIRVKRRGLRIVVTFRLRRRARIAVVGRRKGQRVARSKARVLKPGTRRLVLRCKRKRWPTRLRLSIRELDLPASSNDGDAGDGDAVTTGGGGDTVTTGGARR